MRVFLDTNVLASGLGTRGLCADVVREVLAKHELQLSARVLDELQRTLTGKFRVPPDDVAAITEFLRAYCVAESPMSLPKSLRDRDDEPIVTAAIAAKADVLVTGDGDILSARDALPVRVVDPREFWTLVKKP